MAPWRRNEDDSGTLVGGIACAQAMLAEPFARARVVHGSASCFCSLCAESKPSVPRRYSADPRSTMRFFVIVPERLQVEPLTGVPVATARRFARALRTAVSAPARGRRPARTSRGSISRRRHRRRRGPARRSRTHNARALRNPWVLSVCTLSRGQPLRVDRHFITLLIELSRRSDWKSVFVRRRSSSAGDRAVPLV